MSGMKSCSASHARAEGASEHPIICMLNETSQMHPLLQHQDCRRAQTMPKQLHMLLRTLNALPENSWRGHGSL